MVRALPLLCGWCYAVVPLLLWNDRVVAERPLADAIQSYQRTPQNKIRLRDDPIASDVCDARTGGAPAQYYLDSDTCSWTATSSSGLIIPAAVPGDIISDLHAAGQIANPFFETTWKNSSIWNDNLWTYSTHFRSPSSVPTGSAVLLVFDGIKMGAAISLNGHKLGHATDQFVRYRYDITSVLKADAGATNLLQLAFNNAIDTAGRFMACSGQADWAPYSNTNQHSAILGPRSQPMPTFSFGIWKSVSLVVVHHAAISKQTQSQPSPYCPRLLLQMKLVCCLIGPCSPRGPTCVLQGQLSDNNHQRDYKRRFRSPSGSTPLGAGPGV